MKIIFIISLLIVSLFINSCNKGKYTRIEIITPIDKQTYNGTTSVEVKANIDDDGDSIMNEELLITLNDSAAATPIVDFKDTKFCFEYSLIKSFVAEPGNKYKIEVKARGGHGNWTNKTIIVNCN
jgi:glycerol-3-phosphate dehydrogenase